ncbi:MAG: hypothetical protein ACK4M3_02635 [Pyrobaculum sp.]
MRGVVFVVLLLLAVATYAEDVWTVDTSVMSEMFARMFATFSLLDVSVSAQARYDLFHTAYVTDRGMTIVDKPLVPGDEVREMLSIALSIRQVFENGTAYVVANDTGLMHIITAVWH